MSQETLPTVLEVVGNVWLLQPTIAVLSCITYVTGVWLQQQPEDSVVFVYRLSEICWDKTFNLFVRTDRTPVSPDVIERQGRIGAAVTCTSDVLIGIWFCFDECLFNLSHANGRERVYRRCVPHWAGPFRRWFSLSLGGIICSVMLTACAAVSQHACKMVDTCYTDTFHWIISLFLLVDTPPNEFKPVLLCNCVL